MQTELAPEFQGTREGLLAQDLLRRCVHCGFCNATCPTYQLLGDELDGPRGRIYLIKQVLEGQTPTRSTQLHLDRCLTCRNCESTCPSGVEYGALLEVGRELVDARVARPPLESATRWLLKEGLTSRWFAPALRLGQWFRPLLPRTLRAKVPAPSHAGSTPTGEHARKVLTLEGCVQPALAPNINAATARVFDAAGIQIITAPGAGCCGAVRSHLSDGAGGRADMRRNIDAWWPLLDGVEAIVVNASGCSVMVKDYGHALADDPAYADKAARVAALARDASELLPELARALLERRPTVTAAARATAPLAYHPPCTLQHGQQLRGGVEAGLRSLGFSLDIAPTDSHLCCGSAGTYSVLQPALATSLRDRKLAALAPLAATTIVSANIGCIQHLQSGTDTPVRHWIEVLDDALTRADAHA